MAESSHMFLFAVFVFYGFLFMMYTMSNGAIAGLQSSNILVSTPSAIDTGNPLIYALETATYAVTLLSSFFFTLFINPYSAITWMIPLNWAIFGTVVYIYLKLIRGGG